MNTSKVGRDFIAEVQESSDCISNAIDFLLYKADKILSEAIQIRNPHHKNNLLQKINTDGKKSYEYILTYLLHEKADRTSIRGGGETYGELIPLKADELSTLQALSKINTNEGIFLLLTYLYKAGFFEDNPDYMGEVGDILVKYAQQFQNVIKDEIEGIQSRYRAIVHPTRLLTFQEKFESISETSDMRLFRWLKEIMLILESGSIAGEGDYISEFYDFLVQNQFLTAEEIQDFLETGDDLQNLFTIIDNILMRNFLGDFPEELSELLDIYLYTLSNKGETERYKKLVDFFQNNDE